MAYIGNQPTVGNFVKLDAIVTSATATYNLLNGGVAYTPASVLNMIVSLNGVIQEPTTASNIGGFTVSGSTIVFTSALTSADVIDFILVLGDVLNIGTPSDSTVGFSKVTSNLITGATAETTIAGGDSVLIYDDSASALRKMTRTNFVSGLGGLTQATLNKSTTAQVIPDATTTLVTITYGNDVTIGSNMTYSSGIWSFPETGYYLITSYITAVVYPGVGSNVGLIDYRLETTTDNSTYAIVGYTGEHINGIRDGTAVGLSTSYIFDVTDISTHKLRFRSYKEDATSNDTDLSGGILTIIKLANT